MRSIQPAPHIAALFVFAFGLLPLDAHACPSSWVKVGACFCFPEQAANQEYSSVEFAGVQIQGDKLPDLMQAPVLAPDAPVSCQVELSVPAEPDPEPSIITAPSKPEEILADEDAKPDAPPSSGCPKGFRPLGNCDCMQDEGDKIVLNPKASLACQEAEASRKEGMLSLSDVKTEITRNELKMKWEQAEQAENAAKARRDAQYSGYFPRSVSSGGMNAQAASGDNPAAVALEGKSAPGFRANGYSVGSGSGMSGGLAAASSPQCKLNSGPLVNGGGCHPQSMIDRMGHVTSAPNQANLKNAASPWRRRR